MQSVYSVEFLALRIHVLHVENILEQDAHLWSGGFWRAVNGDF